jgi:3-methylcrotonyl-CoA carboxylase alpha subunit
MKRFVNGVESDLSEGAVISKTTDRLWIETAVGKRSAVAIRQGDSILVSFLGRQFTVEKKANTRRGAASTSSGTFLAPMPGQIVDIFVAIGDVVTKGQKMVVLEAMKTQQPCVAPFDGSVAELPVTKGQQVTEGQLLIQLTAAE